MMKNINEIIKNGKRVVMWVFLLLVSSYYHSCMDDELVTTTDGEIGSGTEAVVLININTPETSIPTAQTRAQTENEYQVSEIDVLVFIEEDDAYVFNYRVKGEDLTAGNVAQTQFKALLVATDDPVKLYVLANAAVSLEGDPLTVGMTEAQVRALLVMDFTSEGMVDNLPMFGEYEFGNGLSSTMQQQVTVDVLRAIARVDVVLDLEPESGDFIFDAVYVYRANDLIQVIPNTLVAGSTPRVDTPSVPGDADLLDTFIKKENVIGIDSVGQIYLPESIEAVANADKLTGRTTIVVSGYFENRTISYYRIDFDSGLSGHPFGQILRNHRYVFRIKSVLSEGWPTPEDAANNIATSMLVEAVTWEDFSSEIVLTGDERFGISGREISLRYVKDREKSLYVESTFDYTIQWIENGEPVGESTSARNVPIENEDFRAWIVRENSDPADVTRLVFRTLKHNHNGADIITDTLRISVGGVWLIDIAVKQDNAAKFSNRSVNVMSVGPVADLLTYPGTGNLGVSAVSHDASAIAMRKLIDVQFSEGGRIPIGGSVFSRITVASAASTNAANLVEIGRIINSQDVIYFTYNVTVSTGVVNFLVDWLQASPKHVLIIATDSESSNSLLRQNSYINAGEDWLYTYSFSDPSAAAITTVNFNRANALTGSEDFFDGPFGSVGPDATFLRADVNVGYSTVIPENVTPLIVGSNSGFSGFMCVGINKGKRIIYHGDANLFMVNAMSNENGNVNPDRPLDILNANVWAWIVEQVIYGDQ